MSFSFCLEQTVFSICVSIDDDDDDDGVLAQGSNTESNGFVCDAVRCVDSRCSLVINNHLNKRETERLLRAKLSLLNQQEILIFADTF